MRARTVGLLVAAWVVLGCSGTARAAAEPGDPFAYDLRVALQPLAFQAAVSQSWFGSAARIEYGGLRFVDIAIEGRVAWLNANQDAALAHSYAGRFMLSFHLSQSIREQPLYGNVYPSDTAAISPGPVGTSQDLMEIPSNERLRTGMAAPQDRDLTLRAAMRDAHSLRVGGTYLRVLQRARPDVDAMTRNDLPLLHVGYSFGRYWNLQRDVTGKREVGYRRFYGDVLVTVPSWIEASPERTRQGGRIQANPLGARIGLQGALEGLLEAAPSLGVAYDLELGAYPGRGGIEGYLFLALGVAIDAATR